MKFYLIRPDGTKTAEGLRTADKNGGGGISGGCDGGLAAGTLYCACAKPQESDAEGAAKIRVWGRTELKDGRRGGVEG